MKRKPHISNGRLFALGLALTVYLTSCNLPQPTITLPPQGDAPALASVTPSSPTLLPIKTELVCPMIPSTAVLLPPAPYDEQLGDCALIGKSEEIEAWLTALEQIAASCQANRATNWSNALVARADLDSQIDEFVKGPQDLNLCTPYGSPEPAGAAEGSPLPTHYYTRWLKSIGENVGEYCTMIDELVQPLWQACDEINFSLGKCQTDPEWYHSIVNTKMNVAQINFNYTDFFYTDTLQTSGWGNFRLYYSEASNGCSNVDPIPLSTLPSLLQTPSEIPAPRFAISGMVWNDGNANGLREAREAGLPDVQVELRLGSCSGRALSSLATGASGAYTFEGLAAGSYCVRVSSPLGRGWTATTPAEAVITIGPGGEVNFGYISR
jgi:hypothetical protein